MSYSVCLDASFVVKLVTSEPESQVARALWEQWASERVAVFAPVLMPFEVASTLRKHVQRGLISQQAGDASLRALTIMLEAVQLIHPESLLDRAWSLAELYGLTVVYDATYVALAEQLDADLWTGDGRMLRAMPQHAGRIRVLSPQP